MVTATVTPHVDHDTSPFTEIVCRTKGVDSPHFILPRSEFLSRTVHKYEGVAGRHSRQAAESLYAAHHSPLDGEPVVPDEHTVAALAYWESWLLGGTPVQGELSSILPDRYAEYITKMAARDMFAQQSVRLQQLFSALEMGNDMPEMAQDAIATLKQDYDAYGFDSFKDAIAFARQMRSLRNAPDYVNIVRPAAKKQMLAAYDPAIVERYGLSVSDSEVDAGFFDFFYLNELFKPYALNEDGEFGWDVAMHRLGIPVGASRQLRAQDGQIPDVSLITRYFTGWNKSFIRNERQSQAFLRQQAVA
ncbi:MAG: hypothetical protein TR69_WS6001000131 [candidate division WS6 bacterium OLB20]|uniref:Uncharacterized protein n=1 Tax=candidate division WS6 bacterium OLB20 TaxID=1617426 RepID=A0A136M029_9BACT|nr:MAG: hypothetical protein TR69_WS6001000131 [candidate division WS6 bacterium OLB20]